MKNKTLFAGLVGLAAGVILTQNWRVITKESIKFGLRTAEKVKEVSQQAMEDFGDLTAEANEELSESEREVM
jgi:hypothetical protein